MTESKPDPWAEISRLRAEISRLIAFAEANTFQVGDIWLSPRYFHFRVIHVSPDGVATFHKDGPGWHREVKMHWNSPKLHRWQLLERGQSSCTKETNG